MAVTQEHLRIVPIDLDATDQGDRLGVVALPERSLGLDPTDRSVAGALVRSLLAIQGEGTLHGRFERLVGAAIDLLGVVVRVASLADVIRSKQAANRPKDQRVLPTLRDLLARISGGAPDGGGRGGAAARE